MKPLNDMVSDEETGGFSNEFLEPINKRYECPICVHALKEPVQLPCGHRLCESCFTQLPWRNEYKLCPLDRERVPRGTVFSDVGIKREVLDLKVKCLSYGMGCRWTGELRKAENHKNVCGYEDIQCINEGCTDVMQRRQLDDHVRDMCRQRLIRCQYCHMDFKFTDIDQHVQEGCTHFPVNCENDGCTVEVAREKMEEHLLQCLFTPVPCIYADIGCMHKCPREKVNNHMETSRDSHLKHATRKIKTLEQTVEIQQEKLQQLGIQVKELKDEFKRDRELHIREMQKQKEFNTHLEEEKDDLVRQIYEIAEKHNKQEKEEQIRIAHFNNQDFIWKIADYRHKPKNSPWPSEEFYIRGYKIKLYATINIGNELLVSIELLKGEFDDRLPWPFKHIITLSVLDNDGDSPFKGKTINPPKDCHGRFFQKPARESNERTGPFSVLSLNKTKGKHSIKESILLRFSVSQ